MFMLHMEYCGPIGLPYSQFLSWDEDDQDAAIAWKIAKSERCERCGTFPADWINPETGIPYNPPPFMPGADHCIGCETIEQYRKNLPEDRQLEYRLHLKPWRRQDPKDDWDE